MERKHLLEEADELLCLVTSLLLTLLSTANQVRSILCEVSGLDLFSTGGMSHATF